MSSLRPNRPEYDADEHILYSSLVPRARLLAGLLETLEAPEERA